MNGWRIFYSLGILPVLYIVLQGMRIVNRKVRRGFRGRRGLFRRLAEAVEQFGESPRLWIHVSSMGEFEQAKPIAALAKERWPQVRVVVSFFSPSGYEHRGDVPYVDFFTYLPFDSPRNARRFVSVLKPSVGIVVRHDIWPNHVATLKKQGIPSVLVDASLPPDKGLLRSLRRSVYRRLFADFTVICAISEEQAKAIQQLVPSVRVLNCGDTRYDQVVRRARELDRIQDLLSHPSFKNIDILVLGSTWPSDEAIVFPALVACLRRPGTRAIVCPHEPTDDRILEITEYFREHDFRPVTLSEWRKSPSDEWDVIVVDGVGLLANLYALGQVAYVGGSFGPGVHSVLEPAAHGRPVVIGPRYENSPDARLLVQQGGAIVVRNAKEAEEVFQSLLDDPLRREHMAVAALRTVREHTGATENVLEVIAEYVEELD